jgi:hypothetical protein
LFLGDLGQKRLFDNTYLPCAELSHQDFEANEDGEVWQLSRKDLEVLEDFRKDYSRMAKLIVKMTEVVGQFTEKLGTVNA